MLGDFLSKNFLIFLLTGGTAAIVNFVARIFFNQFFSFSLSIILAYLVGMITAYLLARRFVFPDSQRSVGQSALFFTLVNIFAVLQTWLISLAMFHYVMPLFEPSNPLLLGYSKEISHAIGIAVPVFTSYIGHKRWSFS